MFKVRLMRFSLGRCALLFILAANGALIALAGCGHTSVRPPVVMAPQSVPTVIAAAHADFVGNTACAKCHPAEFKAQNHTRHMQSLRVVSRKGLGLLAPLPGPILHTELCVFAKGDRIAVGVPAQSSFALPLDYALGSGKSGMTYVSVLQDGRVAEITMSYFPHLKIWHITPGDQDMPRNVLARLRPPDGGRGCFSCHAVMDAHQTAAPAKKFFGVGCESCHGPGSVHVHQMQAGDFHQVAMDDLSRWPASRILELCGQCHGSAQSAMSGTVPVTTQGTNRFQPLGLAESRCFQGSKDTLSCVTCHDPHTNVSTNQKAYENSLSHLPYDYSRAPPRAAAGGNNQALSPSTKRMAAFSAICQRRICLMKPLRSAWPTTSSGFTAPDIYASECHSG